jgi:hypothetical protein
MSDQEGHSLEVPSWTELRAFHPGDSYAARGQSIDLLEMESLHIDYPDQAEFTIGGYVNALSRVRSNPNIAVGGATYRKGQSFGRPLSIIAVECHDDYLQEELLAHVDVTDNTFSQHRGPVGLVDRALKLSRTELGSRDLIGQRYMRLGLFAISNKLRNRISNSDNEANELDAMIAYGMSERDPRQPMLAYPHLDEHFLKAQLSKIGMAPEEGEESEHLIFRHSYSPTVTERWVGNHSEVAHRIAGLSGAELMLSMAGVELAHERPDSGYTFRKTTNIRVPEINTGITHFAPLRLR